jgi:uncharacterized protein (TIRG00374 family)
MRSIISKPIRSLLSILTTLICLSLAGYHFVQHPESFDLLTGITEKQLFSLLALHLLLLIIHTIRFRLILQKCAGKSIPFCPWIVLFVQGRFYNTFVPQLGNVYRSVELKKRFQISYTKYITTLICVGWISTGINIFFAWILIVQQSPELLLGQYRASVIVGVVAIGNISGPFLIRYIFELLKPKNSMKIFERLNEVLSVTTSIVQDRRWFALICGYSLVGVVLACLNIHICFAMVQSTPLIGETAVFYTLLQISNVIKITPGNLGPQEIAFGLLGAQSSVGMSQGILASALFRSAAIVTLCLSMIGLLFGKNNVSK